MPLSDTFLGAPKAGLSVDVPRVGLSLAGLERVVGGRAFYLGAEQHRILCRLDLFPRCVLSAFYF